jgi:hypothetical protein
MRNLLVPPIQWNMVERASNHAGHLGKKTNPILTPTLTSPSCKRRWRASAAAGAVVGATAGAAAGVAAGTMRAREDGWSGGGGAASAAAGALTM